jgi:peptide/nickel transport system permease protein
VLVFIVRRLFWAVLLAVVITVITFVIFFLVPNNAATLRVGRGSLAQSLQTQFSLQGSLPEQYAHFVGHILTGDFGRSTRTRDQASDAITEALPVTASLVIGGALMWFLIAFPIGLLSALRPRSLLDKGLMVFVVIGVSAHPVWLSLVLSYLLGAKLHLLPVGDYCNFFADRSERCGGAVDWASHLVLPWLTFALLFAALYARMIRASVLELMDEDWVRTARAKGAGTSRVLRKHVLRNALLPVVSMAGMDVGVAFAGALFIESAFGLPGMGQLLYRSATSTDLPVTMGVMLVVSCAVALSNLVADVLCFALDPRIRAHPLGSGRRWRPTSAWLRREPAPARVTETAT